MPLPPLRERRHVAYIEPGEDGWWVATIPSLPGCVSQGQTVDEAERNLLEALELWLEVEDDTASSRPAGAQRRPTPGAHCRVLRVGMTLKQPVTLDDIVGIAPGDADTSPHTYRDKPARS